MEVEEDPHRDLPSHGDAKSSQSKEPPATKAPPRAHCPGASSLTRLASREVASSDEHTLLLKSKSPRVYTPMPKPHEGKKAAAPVPAPEPGDTAAACPNMHAAKPGQSPLPKMARDTPHQAGRSLTRLRTGGLAGVPSPFSGLANVCGGVHEPVPVTVSVPITLNVLVTLFPFVSVPVPVSVIVLVPVLPPDTLFALARGGLSGPPKSPFAVGLRALSWYGPQLSGLSVCLRSGGGTVKLKVKGKGIDDCVQTAESPEHLDVSVASSDMQRCTSAPVPDVLLPLTVLLSPAALGASQRRFASEALGRPLAKPCASWE
ncbi:hypothetical protein P4O66_008230, partial [Electrophorus voltai]